MNTGLLKIHRKLSKFLLGVPRARCKLNMSYKVMTRHIMIFDFVVRKWLELSEKNNFDGFCGDSARDRQRVSE